MTNFADVNFRVATSMKELLDIQKGYEEALRQGNKVALATVVQIEGSSYRRPGARMLVTDEGNVIGSISGGCLEGDALRKAMQVMLQGKSRLVTYDTSDEDDLSIGVQMGCEGIIKVLFEPVDQHQPDNPVNLIKKVLGSRSNAVLITFFSLDARKNHAFGTCMLLESDHSIHGSIPIPELRADVIKDAHRALEEKHTLFDTYQLQDRHITAIIEFLCPRL